MLTQALNLKKDKPHPSHTSQDERFWWNTCSNWKSAFIYTLLFYAPQNSNLIKLWFFKILTWEYSQSHPSNITIHTNRPSFKSRTVSCLSACWSWCTGSANLEQEWHPDSAPLGTPHSRMGQRQLSGVMFTPKEPVILL